MAKKRSPNYPAIDIDDAIEAIKPVWAEETRNKMSRLVLAKHLGYSSLNGRALSKIGAVRAYGLIDGSGDELRVSDDAMILLEAPSGDPKRQQTKLQCALKPPLFKDLHGKFESKPSDENVRFQLIQDGFTPEAAGKAVKIFLATMDVVSAWGEGYNPHSQDEQQSEEGGSGSEEPGNQGFTGAVKPPAPDQKPPKPGMKQDIFTVDEGELVVQWPAELSKNSFEDIKDFLAILERKIQRTVNSEPDEKE